MGKVDAYLELKKGSSDTELASKFSELEDLYNKKLWHQLTLGVLELSKMPQMKTGTELVDLYSNLIAELENKANPLSLAELAETVVDQISDPEEAIKFMETLAPKISENIEAKVLCIVVIAQIVLYKIEDKERTKKLLEDAEKLLDEIDGVTAVHGKFYKVLSELYCMTGSHAKYYRAALRYLGCIDLKTLDDATKAQQAFFLGLAALLGEGIYNFGELLAHPILSSMEGTSSEWLMKLLYAFNEGNISLFESMKVQWATQPDLLTKEVELREKIILLCLMEMTFKRKAFDRQLSFSEIAQETTLPLDQVEVMVMRALSLGLVKGTIDEVDQKVNITWVQPRVLDKSQLSTMMDFLRDWFSDVNTMENLLAEQAKPILTL